MNSIQSISRASMGGLPSIQSLNNEKSENSSFKEMLMNSIQEVNSMQQEANSAVEAMATGEDVNPAEVFTAVQKADTAFRMLMQVRNKLVQAYDEVKNIRI